MEKMNDLIQELRKRISRVDVTHIIYNANIDRLRVVCQYDKLTKEDMQIILELCQKYSKDFTIWGGDGLELHIKDITLDDEGDENDKENH